MSFAPIARALVSCLVLFTACHAGPQAVGPQPVYPELMRQAQISGFYPFRVPLDSAGVPDASHLKATGTAHAGFDQAVRRAVAAWRPTVPPGTRVIEHTILFLVLPVGSDSVSDCPQSRAYTVVCAVAPPVIVHVVH